jgi:hypothetical protein
VTVTFDGALWADKVPAASKKHPRAATRTNSFLVLIGNLLFAFKNGNDCPRISLAGNVSKDFHVECPQRFAIRTKTARMPLVLPNSANARRYLKSTYVDRFR